MGGTVAGAGASNAQSGASALNQYLNTAANYGEPTVNAESIASQMSPYMNQYVSMALQPQLQEAANTYMLQSQAQQGAATSAGAFGDPRAALLQSNLGLNYALENQGLVGNAYNAAFNTAIGAGAQDVANNLTAQTTNAGLYNTGLANLLAGSNAAYNQGTGATNLLNTLGSQQTAQSQAQLNALYNQYLMAQQYPFQTTGLVNSTISSTLPTNVTTTTTQPNNAGYGILGSLLGGAGGLIGGYNPTSGAGMGLMGLAMLAEGGDVDEGQTAIVGEKGPEVFTPQRSGTVIPYEKLKKAIENKRGLKVPDLGPAKSSTPSFGIAA